MRRLLRLLDASASLLALALSIAAALALAFEVTGRLRWALKAQLGQLVRPLGLNVEMGAVELRWFEPAIEVEDLRLFDETGRTAFAAQDLRCVLRPFGPTPFVDRIEIAEGELAWDESRWLASSSPAAPPPRWIEDERAWPEVRVAGLLVTAELGATGELDLGRIDVRLSQTDAGPRIDGAWRPPQSDTPVAIAGQVPAGASIEMTATAVGLDPLTLPAGIWREEIAAWQPRGRADVDVTMRLPRAGDVRPIVDARLRIVDGGVALPDGRLELDAIQVDVAGSYDPNLEPSFALDARAEGAWNEASLAATLVAGRAAGAHRFAHGSLRATDVEAHEATFDLLPLEGDVDPLYPALRPEGHAHAGVDVVFESPTADPSLLVVIEPADDVSVAWHGFIGEESGRRIGFPLRVDSARGRVVIADHPTCDRRTKVALMGLRGTTPTPEGTSRSVIEGEGLIVSPPGADERRWPELDLWFEGQGLTADDNVADGLAGLGDADWIWPDFRPAGGSLAATTRIVLLRHLPDPMVAVDVHGRDVGFRWSRIPVPMRSNRFDFAFFFDGRGGIGLETQSLGSAATIDEIEVSASVLIDPAERARGKDEIESLTSAFRVDARNVPLRGDDAAILFDSLEPLAEGLSFVDAKGKADVAVELVQPLAGGDMGLAVDVLPRQLELTPTEFPVTARNVRGRVLVNGELENPFDEDASEEDDRAGRTRLALAGHWAGGARVAMIGTVDENDEARHEFFGAGLRPADRNFTAAVSRVAGAAERGSGGASSVELDGRVDGSGTLTIDRDGEVDAAFRALLRGNDLRLASGEAPLLRGMSGTVDATDEGLVCSELSAVLGRTPVSLEDTTLTADDAGTVRIETRLTADDLPLDRDHLRWFTDEEVLDNLVDDLDFRGSIDVERAEFELEQRPTGDSHVRFRGRTVLSDVSLRVGLPISIRSGYADIEKLIFEGGRVRAWARLHDLYARIAGRNLDAASMLATYHAPRLNILSLDGSFAGGRAHGLRTETSRTGPVLSLDLTEPYRFELGASLVEVEVEEILQDVFDSAIASDGLLSADLRLAGNLENLMAMQGSGSGRVEKARLWSLPVVRVILSALGAQNTVVFDEVYSRFQIEDGLITMSDIKVMSPLLQLIGFGTLDFDGRVDYELQVRYGLLDHLGPLTRLIYWIQNNLITIAVRGDMSRPRVRFLGLLGIASFGSDDAPEREMPLPPLSPLPERF